MRWTQQQYEAYELRRKNSAASKVPDIELEPKVKTKKPRSDIGSKRPRHFQSCQQCGKSFHAPHSIKRKFCSLECAYANKDRVAHVKPKDRGFGTCGRCGKEFRRRTRGGKGLFCSQTCAAATNSNGQHGWIEVGGRRFYVRSRWEANYARYLEWAKTRGIIREWDYEPDTFWFESIKRGTRSYLPDFRVKLISGEIEYHEVKGWMDAKSKTKLNRMRIYHPSVRLELIDQKRFKALAKTVSHLVPGWVKCK